MSNAPISFAELVEPILSAIGYDFKRIREVSDDDLVIAYNAHVVANYLMTSQLVADVGDKDLADRILLHARRLPEAKQSVRREQFAEAIERIGKAAPRLFAAHIAYGMDIETALGVEIERRLSPTN